jgi:hypothetical protein
MPPLERELFSSNRRRSRALRLIEFFGSQRFERSLVNSCVSRQFRQLDLSEIEVLDWFNLPAETKWAKFLVVT